MSALYSNALQIWSQLSFAQPYWFLALLLLPVLVVAAKMGLFKGKGYIGYSDGRLLNSNPGWLRALKRVPATFALVAAVLMVVALARPQVPGVPQHRTIAGRDIELIVDISFSMSFPFKGQLEPHVTPPELDFKVPFEEARRNEKGNKFVQPKEGWQRVHAAQNALLRFIENRWQNKTGDRIGLIVFDSHPRYAWPITDDLRQLYRKTQFIATNLGNATNFGRNPPGPLDLAVDHFKEYGQAKSRVLIMVTDGEDPVDFRTQMRLVKLLQDNNVRFYLVGIGETLARQDVDIYKVAKAVGGRVFRVEDTQSLNDCFATIDKLEKSELTVSEQETRDEVFFYFVWGAVICFGLSLLTEAFMATR